MASSWAINDTTCWNPTAGPPVRISRFTPVRQPAGHQRAGHDLRLSVDRRVRSDHLIERTVLGLGEPVGLDDDRFRAHRGKIDARTGVGGDRLGLGGHLLSGRFVVAAAGGNGDGGDCTECSQLGQASVSHEFGVSPWRYLL